MKNILIIITFSILISGCGGGTPNKIVGKGPSHAIPTPESILSSTPENITPTITGTPKRYLLANTDYSFTPDALDLDGDDLTFTIENKPTWAIFNNASGELKGTPTAANEYRNIKISVSDNIESTSLPTFNITVQTPPNNAPTISGTAATVINTNFYYQFIPTATDLDGDDLTFTIANKPTWATFSNANGELKGTPIVAKEYRGIKISVSDNVESASLPVFNITVQAPPNNAPTISGAAPTLIKTNSDYQFIPSATDLDGDNLTFTIANKPTWATFSNANGELKGTPIAVNEYQNIKISVSDSVESSSLPAFNITVQAPPNTAPTISGSAPTLIETDSEYLFIPSATDLDGDNLTFTIENKPTWASFSNVSGELRGTPIAVNEYQNIKISVSDGIESTSLPVFNITVQAPEPEPNTAPTISGAAPTLIETDSEYLFIPSATDLDGDNLTFTIENQPTWATFSNMSGELKGTPTEANEYRGIKISVFDGIESTSLPAFNITVQSPPNNAPTISGAAPTLIETDSEYLFIPSGNDLDGDNLTFTIENKPTWATFSNVSGELKGTPIAANEYRGIKISVSDNVESSSLPVFNITVQAPPNNAPTISGTALTLIETDSEYLFIPLATDLDGDNLTLTIENKPTWATFSNVSGELKGTPITANEYQNIKISVSDGIESASLPAFNITVQSPPNTAPTISGAAATVINTDSDYQFIPTAIDQDGDDLTFTIENKPSWATFNNISGELKGTPVETNEYRDIKISVSDSIESTSLPTFNIIVQAPPNNAPTISGTAATVINTDSDYQFIPTATDLDGDDLTFTIENKPTWATFSNVSGELKGTPIAVKEYRDIKISVSDNVESTSLPAFDIEVLSNLHSVAISWEAPTTDVDGDDIEGLTGYKIMYGQESKKYEYTLSIDDPNMTSATISDLERKDHYFSMRAITLHGLESETAIEYVYLYLN